MLKFQWKDKSGRGETASNLTLKNVLMSENEEGWIGGFLHDWAKEAEEGDIWENRTDMYICISKKVKKKTKKDESRDLK